MFLAVFVANLFTLGRNLRGAVTTMYYLGIVGVLFSGGLSVYEVFIVKTPQVPACVYGLVFYLGILVSVVLWRRRLAVGALPKAPPAAGTPQP
jgi:hypothetical protein